MTKAPELLPCPFCGDTSLTYRAASEGDSYYCDDCGAYGPLSSPDTIKDKWNTRVDAETLKVADELARLLNRYFTETPLGHQPHMIDEDTQKALAAYDEKRGERE